MATTPTSAGSLIGCIDGMSNGAHASGTTPAGITFCYGTPDNCLTGQTGSDIAFDVAGRNFYMCEAQSGSEWIKLVSGA